jgi:hypothetical protein
MKKENKIESNVYIEHPGGWGGVSAYRHVIPHPISFSNIKVLKASRISFNEMDEGEGKQRE